MTGLEFLQRLQEHLRGFEVRPSQQAMLAACERVITAGGVLLVEAPTGVGKTFAYAIPAILSAKKTIISTNKKNLQDQLMEKDLPLLARVKDFDSRWPRDFQTISVCWRCTGSSRRPHSTRKSARACCAGPRRPQTANKTPSCRPAPSGMKSVRILRDVCAKIAPSMISAFTFVRGSAGSARIFWWSITHCWPLMPPWRWTRAAGSCPRLRS
jgi:hypothetical protein